MHPILIAGDWVQAKSEGNFQATDPSKAEKISDEYPVSSWADCDRALNAASQAFADLQLIPVERLVNFLLTYADRIEARTDAICELANRESGLPVKPRLADIELPRTTNQLRQAAGAARNATWCQPTIDSNSGIRSIRSAIGPVAVFGPNNFPLAFGSISGGDFAAALAAGNPVIAKANSAHPGTTRLLAEEANHSAKESGLPAGMVQMLYRTSHMTGERLVADPRLASVGYTGSRAAGLKLKRIADDHGKPIYLELSSINPVVVLPGALAERATEIAEEISGSCLMGTGQFCTSPGLIVVFDGPNADLFVERFVDNMSSSPAGILLSSSVRDLLVDAVGKLVGGGAQVLCGGVPVDGMGIRYANTCLQTNATTFLTDPEIFQTEAFGNAALIVRVTDRQQCLELIRSLEGNLTGTIYSQTGDEDDADYDELAPELRQRVGRLLNDKMPTGVAVSPAMNHGGPFPATGHPGFSAVGLPGSIVRFSMLQCFDNVRQHRLPENLRDENPNNVLRHVDGNWTLEPIGATV